MRPDWREVPRGDISPCWAGWYVTMNPKGLIAMTRPTYERMGAPQAFVVLWDSVNNRIGLKPAADNAECVSRSRAQRPRRKKAKCEPPDKRRSNFAAADSAFL